MTIRDSAIAAAGVGIFILCIVSSIVLSDFRDDAHATRLAITDPEHGLVAIAHGDLVETRDEIIGLVDGKTSAIIARTDRRTGEALDSVRTAAANADIQATGLRMAVNGQLTALNNTAALLAGSYSELPTSLNTQLGTLNATLATTAQPIRETAQQVDDAAPLFLDCDHNPDCVYNRYQGVAKSLEKVGTSSQGIAADVKREADELTRPQTKWQQFRTWLLAIARIFGAL